MSALDPVSIKRIFRLALATFVYMNGMARATRYPDKYTNSLVLRNHEKPYDLWTKGRYSCLATPWRYAAVRQ